MMGAFCGMVLAFWYRREGPQKPEPQWLSEDDDEIEFSDADDNILSDNKTENEK